ncbi:MAG TPA: hypothetical protein PKI11_20320, partial [Candidatus Hydrogenedentes bacterium]|nr:hypothetical protein [Candidatus Hydrogenedentota bacterium]
MSPTGQLRGSRLSTIFLAALSLSIGWGIRGNFGHEYGAMIPGCLTAIVVCLLSGREDWRERVPYFAFFGALGWAFGGSISYMQVIAYTHSGHAPTQYYGFFCLFVIGALWGGMGGAGTALPGVMDRDRLTALFRPICWTFGAFFVLYCAFETVIGRWEANYNSGGLRHESPFYWFDADWIPAATALLAMFAFDLWRRRFQGAHWLAVYAVAGAAGGFVVQCLLRLLGLAGPLAALLVRRQGDAAYIVAKEGIPVEEAAESLVINWPQIFLDIPQHTGWIIGLIVAVCVYFAVHGEFRSGASLIVYMAAGWLIAFLLLPTLLGIRMTPPRSDDWAGILGLYIATLVWLWRNGLRPVFHASVTSAIIGGLGFSGAACIKLWLVALGNPTIESDAAVVAQWAHWQGANWHSFLEQSYGFINGIGIAVAMALLARRAGRVAGDPAQRRWTEVFCVAFVLFGLTFVNVFKNVPTWVNDYKIVPALMKAPLFPSIELSAAVWFNSVYALITLAGVALMLRHMRRPLAFVPPTWLGKGQLLYLVFLWMVVVANFERALPRFSEGRLITEWVIFVNAVVATVLIVTLLREGMHVPEEPERGLRGWACGNAVLGVAAVALAAFGMTWGVREIYGDAHAGHGGL